MRGQCNSAGVLVSPKPGWKCLTFPWKRGTVTNCGKGSRSHQERKMGPKKLLGMQEETTRVM